MSCNVDQFTFHISLQNIKFTIFILLSHNDFDSADPSSMQDLCHIRLSYMTLISQSSCSCQIFLKSALKGIIIKETLSFNFLFSGLISADLLSTSGPQMHVGSFPEQWLIIEPIPL